MRKALFASIVLLATVTGALGGPLRVREVPFPYATIQDAIDDAVDGDTVVVHPGTYTGNGNRDIDFLGKAITVRSEDPEEEGIVAATIINCQASGESPHRAFIFQTSEDANSILAGFTILNAYIRIDGTPAPDTETPGGDGEDSIGGAISCTGTSPIIRNCIMNNCVAEGGTGGAGAPGQPGVPGDPGDPNDPNDDIPAIPPTPGGPGGNAGSGYGGGIYCDPNSAPTILNCKFNLCKALGGTGGAGGAGGTPADPNDPGGPGGQSGVSDANGWGGGICVASGGTATITGCTFVDCNAIGNGNGISGGGGVYYGIGYSGEIDADMTNCMALYGGGVCCDANCALAIAGCSINGGTADAGANIYCEPNCILEISDCNLNDGSAYIGGSICCAPGSTVTINNTNILNNMAPLYGGGIYFASDGNLTLINCDVSSNMTEGAGGGILYQTGGTLMLRGCDLTGNSSGEGAGGGIFAGNLTAELGATTVFSECNITDNTSLYGAGLCLISANSAISDCTISGNMAEYGGGAYLYVSDVNVTNCTVSNNVAATRTYCSGGGFYCLDSTTRIKDCVLTANEAQGFGGAVYIVGPNLPGGAMEFTNCLITDNTAGLDGAGLSLNVDATPTISNCTLAGNVVSDEDGSGGGLACYDAQVHVINSIFWSNVAAHGAQIAVGDPSEPSNPPAGATVSYSDVAGGRYAVQVSSSCVLNWNAGNLSSNPLFVSDYHLSNTEAGQDVSSPCVNAGSDQSLNLKLNRYTTRTDSGPDVEIVDMGYHYKTQPSLCDCDMDGIIDMLDLAIMFSYWLDDQCEMSYDCEGADTDLDKDVDFVDFATCTDIYAPSDKMPPTPNPSLWETKPSGYPQIPGSILMRAAAATDINGVEYRFVCTSGGGHDSGWQGSVLYIDKNLSPGTYKYRCQSRDKSPQQNRTEWSTEESASPNN
ncbi:MAG: hypothetical protein JXN61_03635 [Sedimentisphaerales bacterium]|nr:hypothetical protein [Sedimentisphaerales bacterium]